MVSGCEQENELVLLLKIIASGINIILHTKYGPYLN